MNIQDLRSLLDDHCWARDRLFEALEPLTPDHRGQVTDDAASAWGAAGEVVGHDRVLSNTEGPRAGS